MSESRPKVSVCVVTYNHEKYIRQCLQSILEQEVDFPIEVIVGDDASKDKTRKIIEEFSDIYPHVVKGVFQNCNVGPTQNYLIVHNEARGEYVCHCDGDDFWLPGKLQKQVQFMDDNPKIVQSWHRQQVVDANSEQFGEFPRRFPKFLFGKPLTIEELAVSYGLVGQHSSQMYRRSAKSIRMRDCPTIDYFFALDIASRGLSAHIPDFLGCYRIVTGGSVTQSNSGRDLVDICVIDAAIHFGAMFPTTRRIFKGNILVRAFGAFVKKRKNWREMKESVVQYPISLVWLIRSILVFVIHKL